MKFRDWFRRQRALAETLERRTADLRYWRQVAQEAIEQRQALRVDLDETAADAARWAKKWSDEAEQRREMARRLHEQRVVLAALGATAAGEELT